MAKNRRKRRMDEPSRQVRLAEALNVPVERLRRGEIERARAQIADVDGRPSAPGIVVDTLARLERSGAITPAMRSAGENFHRDFVAAGFVALRAADLNRVHVVGATPPGPGGSIDAKNRLWKALQLVGGLAAPAARALWDIVGCEESLCEWAARSGWANRPIHKTAAAGILIAALGAIEPYYQGA